MYFSNWHQHSDRSWLDGMAKPADIAARCKELGMTHAMVSDHSNCAAHLAFHRECVKAGLVPVLGTELYFKDERYDNGKPKGWHTLIFALNDKGLENVWKISSYTYYATSDGHRIPNARWDMFEGYGEGVVCTSACLAGVMSKAALDDDREMADYWVDRCLATFEDFAIELHTNSMDDQRKANLWLARYAHERGLKTVYAVDAHYVRPEDAEFHDKWLGMATKAYYDQPHWTMDHEYYIQGEDEVRARLAYLGEDEVQKCVECASEILGKVETVTIDGSHKVPHAHLPEGVSDPNVWLAAKACEGLLKKVGGCDASIKIEDGGPRVHVSNWGGSGPEGVADRVRPYVRQLEEKEMPLVVDNGLADYFLMVAGYVEFAKAHSLVGPGRGSAAGSVLCYLLGITSIDPMGKGLVFERFLNQGRLGTHVVRFEGGGTAELGEAVRVKVRGRGVVGAGELSPGDFVECRIGWDGRTEDASVSGAVGSVEFRGGELPDIDVDFEPDFRSTMQMHLVREYGGDKVTAVGTTMFYGMKSALKDLCRYYRLSMAESNRLTSIMEQVEQMTEEGEDWHSVLALLSDSDRQFVEGYEARYPDLFADADRMVGLCRQQGKHAAGFVMSPVPLAGKLPVRKVCHKDALDDVITQFDKYEVEDLGFVKADVLGLRNLETLHQAADTVFGRTGERIDFYSLPESPDDDAVWGMFERGETLGIFQMESQGLTRVAMQLKPRSIMELATIIALYRPAVIGAGMLDEYIGRALGERPVEYLVPQLEPILSGTLGIMCIAEGSLVATERGDIPIEDVRPGDMVYAGDGKLHKCTATVCNGIREVVKVRGTLGEQLVCTPDHRVMTSEGWVEAGDLNENHLMKAYLHPRGIREIEGFDEKDWLLGRFLADGHSGGGATIACDTEEHASRIVEVVKRAFPKAKDSYVRYSTNGIGETWYACIVDDRLHHCGYNGKSSFNQFLDEHGLYRKTGNDKKWPINDSHSMLVGMFEGDGCYKTKIMRLKNESLARGFYDCARSYGHKCNLFEKDGVWSVTMVNVGDVEPYVIENSNKHESNLGYVPFSYALPIPGSLKGSAKANMIKTVDKRLPVSVARLKRLGYECEFEHDEWSRVLSVESFGTARVYDLTIEDEHSFIVGGIVVHNCMQEDVMAIFRELGDFTDTEADRIRAAIGHKKLDQIQAAKGKFLEGCRKRGIQENVSNEIFRQIEASGSYGFNRSHAYSYAVVSYWTAWMKAHHLVEYYAACLGTVGSDKAQEYMADLRRRGCKVVPPLLESLSKGYAVIDDRTISYGLVNIAGMGGVAIDGVMACAPYGGFSDFVDRSGLNRAQIEKMINGGVFRKVYPDRRDLLLRYRGNDFRPNLFGGELTEEGRMLAVHEPYTDAELIEIETEVYGRPLTVDPYEHIAPQIGERAYREQFTAAQLAALRDGFEGFVMGKVVKVRQHRTKKGDMMAFIGVETQLGESLDVSVFPKMWGIARQWIREGTYGYFGLGKETYNGGPSFHLEHYKYLEL